MPENRFTQIKNELIRSEFLTPNEKTVLFVLMSYGNCDEIFIGQKKLAEQSRMSRKTVVATVKSLKDKKFITTKLKPDRSTLIYKLNIDRVVTLSNNVVTDLHKGCNGKLQGVVTDLHTSNTSISNTILEKEKKKKEKSDDLPDWLDKKAWSEWVQFRKELKKTLKPSTIKKQIKFLEENKADHVQIIDQSIMNGWTGLFILKDKTPPEKEINIKEMLDEARRNERLANKVR
jgi:predicted transcriptional regulator